MNDQLESSIRDAVHGREQFCLDLLCRLVAHESVLGNEAPAQEEIAQTFGGLGLLVERVTVDLDRLRSLPGFSPPVTEDYGGRVNVVGVHEPIASPAGKSLILNGHMDVVPTGPAHLWSRAPFEAHVSDGWVYGRGSGDMKAGIAAYCTAFAALRDIGYQPAASVILQSVIEEECTGNGALACLDAGYRADAAIIPEPFGQSLMVAQVGVMWLEVDLIGTPAHVLDTSAGSNAIEAAFAVFRELRVLEATWNSSECKHPAYDGQSHPINFNLGKIDGGDWASTVPCHCTIDIRVGFYPGMELADVRRAVESSIQHTMQSHSACRRVGYDIRYRGFQAEGCVMDRADPMMTLLAELHCKVTGTECTDLASTATTDARFFQVYGRTPATCYGPLAENIHGIDERVSIQSMMEVGEVLALFMANWCGLEPIREN